MMRGRQSFGSRTGMTGWEYATALYGAREDENRMAISAKELRDFAREVDEWEDDQQVFVPRWEPDEGDTIVGEVLRIETLDLENGPLKALIIKDARTGDEASVWCGTMMLRAFLEKEMVQPGMAVGIKYFGEEENLKTGRTFKRYRCQVLGSNAQPKLPETGNGKAKTKATAKAAADDDDPFGDE